MGCDLTDRTVITVGGPTAAQGVRTAVEGQGIWLDGDHAVPQQVRFSYDDKAGALHLHLGADPVRWDYDDIRAVRDQAGQDVMVLRSVADATARLILTDPDDHLLLRARAKRIGRYASHVRRGRLALWAMAAVASVALIIFVLVPVMADRLAEYLPPEGEKALGDATFEQIRSALDETGFMGTPICEAPDGLAALAKMEERLTAPMTLETPLTVHVLDHPMVNAFALPGGYVVLFRGLLEEAGRPEEVAAVFAHEIGHVVARDPTRIALRSAGSIGVLGLLFGDFAGGAVVLFLAEQIIRADYTKEAEAEADTFAHEALLAVDLPPSAIATLFERLDRLHGGGNREAGILEHFNSHPEMGDRIAASRIAEPEGAEFRPVLTETEWAALQSICD